ncbi:MAG TPA: GDSL-type esterase/lipase family protein [Candidatus Binatia bacterium]|nr:GDSL-type esterase/lipase family protein [Candidatus Binatia bacterium]
MQKTVLHRAAALTLGLTAAACGITSDSGAGPGGAAAPATEAWIGAWGAPITGSSAGPANATVRNIVRPTIGGHRLRIRISNAMDAATPLNIAAATVALVKEGAQIVPGSTRVITFNGGSRSVWVPPSTDFVYSDGLDFPVQAQQDLAISLFLPDTTTPVGSGAAWSTSFVTADGGGDRTLEEDGASFAPIGGDQAPPETPLVCSGCSTYALTAIDVMTDEADGAVGAIGSSTFHGNNSTRDSHRRVLDQLSVRVNAEVPRGRQKGIVSAGIGGDTLHAGLGRLARDVWSQSGLKAVMVYDVNDLSSRTYQEIRDDYLILIADAHQRGVQVYCSTWPPAAQSAPAKPTQERSKLNAWLLNSHACDRVVDWDAVLRSDIAPDEYRADYFSDGIHPNDAGHTAMAQAVPVLEWFGF